MHNDQITGNDLIGDIVIATALRFELMVGLTFDQIADVLGASVRCNLLGDTVPSRNTIMKLPKTKLLWLMLKEEMVWLIF